MHPSSSTKLSDCIDKLMRLDSRLANASFTPQEELLGLCVSGSLVIASLAETTVVTQFTDEEIEFVENLTERIEIELAEMYGVSFEDSEDWDSDNGTPECGTP